GAGREAPAGQPSDGDADRPQGDRRDRGALHRGGDRGAQRGSHHQRLPPAADLHRDPPADDHRPAAGSREGGPGRQGRVRLRVREQVRRQGMPDVMIQFEFHSDALPDDTFEVESFLFKEAMSTPFVLELTLLTLKAPEDIKPEDMITNDAHLTMKHSVPLKS